MQNPTHKAQAPNSDNIEYSVIIPAYNEEALLPGTLSSLKRAMQSIPIRGEIIVVDNNSTDNTGSIAERYGTRIIFEPFRQIARARNTGAQAAKGNLYIFLDADTVLPPQLLQTAIELLESGKYCGGGTLLNFDTKLPFLATNLVRIWNWISKTFKLAAGSFVFCLSRGFNEIGGFDENLFAGEEVFLSRRLKSWGNEKNLSFTIIDDQAVTTSGRKFHWYSSLQLMLLLLLLTVFPFGLRYRSLCRFWYNRPEE